ncbi:hypothetical protein BC827DRAFT_1220304 [Russula dissimulans]|nr:hypothetical protein BC827DRAFT_1220304 [Russula dissimulans]
MSRKEILSSSKRASAQLFLANDDECASINDFSDEGGNEIDSVECLVALQQIRQEANRDSQTNFKRQFATLSSEFRGHARAMVEEMNAYIDKLEMDALDTRDAEGISTQADTNAAQEWNVQRVKVNEARVIDLIDMQREENVNEVSKLIEATATKRAQAHRRLLRKVRSELEELRRHEKTVTDAKGLVKRYKRLVCK